MNHNIGIMNPPFLMRPSTSRVSGEMPMRKIRLSSVHTITTTATVTAPRAVIPFVADSANYAPDDGEPVPEDFRKTFADITARFHRIRARSFRRKGAQQRQNSYYTKAINWIESEAAKNMSSSSSGDSSVEEARRADSVLENRSQVHPMRQPDKSLITSPVPSVHDEDDDDTEDEEEENGRQYQVEEPAEMSEESDADGEELESDEAGKEDQKTLKQVESENSSDEDEEDDEEEDDDEEGDEEEEEEEKEKSVDKTATAQSDPVSSDESEQDEDEQDEDEDVDDEEEEDEDDEGEHAEEEISAEKSVAAENDHLADDSDQDVEEENEQLPQEQEAELSALKTVQEEEGEDEELLEENQIDDLSRITDDEAMELQQDQSDLDQEISDQSAASDQSAVRKRKSTSPAAKEPKKRRIQKEKENWSPDPAFEHLMEKTIIQEPDTARRYPKRQRVQQLEYWRNQRIKYGRDSTGLCFKVVGVEDGFPGYDPQRKAKKKIRKPGTQLQAIQGPRQPVNLLDLSIHASNVDQSKLKNNKFAKKLKQDKHLIASLADVEFNPSAVSPEVEIALTQKEGNISRGMLKLKPFGEKTRQQTVVPHTFFDIQYGVVSIVVDNNPPVLLRSGGSLSLENKTWYTIKNLRKDDALVKFTIVR